MTLPQLGISGGVPAPRNPSPASIRIGAPQAYVACTVRGAKVLVFSGVYVLVNLVIDVVYLALDPRTRY